MKKPEEILESADTYEDVHQKNADQWGCSRQQAKRALYCFLCNGADQHIKRILELEEK